MQRSGGTRSGARRLRTTRDSMKKNVGGDAIVNSGRIKWLTELGGVAYKINEYILIMSDECVERKQRDGSFNRDTANRCSQLSGRVIGSLGNI